LVPWPLNQEANLTELGDAIALSVEAISVVANACVPNAHIARIENPKTVLLIISHSPHDGRRQAVPRPASYDARARLVYPIVQVPNRFINRCQVHVEGASGGLETLPKVGRELCRVRLVKLAFNFAPIDRHRAGGELFAHGRLCRRHVLQ
jgi:hypothetical protein